MLVATAWQFTELRYLRWRGIEAVYRKKVKISVKGERKITAAIAGNLADPII
jgi:hypothetical protein